MHRLLGDKPLFAVAPHALYVGGIESALPSVQILTDREGKKSTSDILLSAAFRIPTGARLLLFKPAPKIEHLAKKHGWHFVAPSSELNRRFENKLTIESEFLAANIPFLPSIVKEASALRWEEIVERFGDRVVVQHERGHAGSSSFVVQSIHEWHAVVAEAGERLVKVAPMREGQTWTVNACVTRQATLVSRPFLQLQQMKETGADNPLTTCGNWHKEISEKLAMDLMGQVERFGAHLRKEGYCGWFGLDALVSSKGIEGWIECNPRLTASVGIFSELQVEAHQTPLILLHTLEHLGIEYPLDVHELQHALANGFSEYHLVFRTRTAVLTGAKVRPGIYDSAGSWMREGTHWRDLREDELLLRVRASGMALEAQDPFAMLFSRSEISEETRKRFDEILANTLS